jgi:transposase InsO family protein
VTIALVKEAVSAGARLESACKEIGIDARTLQRWTAVAVGDDRRRGPKEEPANALTKAEEEDIVALLNAEEFAGLSPHQVVAKLADMNIYKASERTMYRILRRRKLLRHRDRSRPRTARRPDEHVATGPRQVWSWDITYLRSPVKGIFWLLYMVVDVWSRKVVAARVHANESDELASALIEEACRREGIVRDQLVIHSDNGPAMKGKTVLAMMQDLGVVPSFSRPRVSDDNPFSEALFRTMKYRPGYPDQPFPSLGEAQAWVDDFVRWYNEDHQHSGIRFVTPAQRHDGHEHAILANRARVYAAARARTPDRWAGPTRNWTPVPVVRLNPRPASAKEAAPAKPADQRAPKGPQAGVAAIGATAPVAASGGACYAAT